MVQVLVKVNTKGSSMIGKKFGPDISYNKRLSKSVAKKKVAKKKVAKKPVKKPVRQPASSHDDHDHSIEVSETGTIDKGILSNYERFIQAAEKKLNKKLLITTGGKSKNHLGWKGHLEDALEYYGVTQEEVRKGSKKSKSGNVINQALINRAAKMMSDKENKEYDRGALDIGFGDNNLKDSDIKELGKLALQHHLRVGEEDHHLHVDSRHNDEKGNETKRVFHENRVKESDPRRAASVARKSFFDNYLKEEEQKNIKFNEEAMSAQKNDKEAAKQQLMSHIQGIQ